MRRDYVKVHCLWSFAPCFFKSQKTPKPVLLLYSSIVRIALTRRIWKYTQRTSTWALTFFQSSVRPVPQFVTFDIVSRCFENKKNNCWETKLFKNTICLLFTNLQIHFWQLFSLDVLAAGLPDYGFVNNKQMAFLKIFISQQLLFF